MTLPPGQHEVDGFPRFGTHLYRPPPDIPADYSIEFAGAVAEPFELSLPELSTLPHCERTADFHCVSGWSATGLRWEGVAFETLYRRLIEPALRPGADVTHVVFRGLDGYGSVVTIEDALQPDVLVADRLDGRPLEPDHGAPVRLVSPSQYGFVSTKHLCRIDVRSSEPPLGYGASLPFVEAGLRVLATPHQRARVWEEERHRYVPARLLRPVYRLLIPPIRWASARGSRPRRAADKSA
jgi:DMSO/TMAO reductase YedYZ molybdopterin-dependent catalytic subunit